MPGLGLERACQADCLQLLHCVNDTQVRPFNKLNRLPLRLMINMRGFSRCSLCKWRFSFFLWKSLHWKVHHVCSSHHQDHSAFIDPTPLQYTSALASLDRMSRWQQVLSSLKCLLFGPFVPKTDGNIQNSPALPIDQIVFLPLDGLDPEVHRLGGQHRNISWMDPSHSRQLSMTAGSPGPSPIPSWFWAW